MHRPWWYRALGAFSALLFAAAIVEPVTLHPCPMHDGIPAMSMAGAAHTMGQGHGAHHHDQGTRHHCNCLGACSSATGVGLPGHTVVPRIATVAIVPVLVPAAPSATPSTPDFVLPFANGPPSIA
ncbi:MAG: hypothetical protein IRY91_11225 [Gemmatimonadaceae bacterium]|nr:hypothetical protein [Gemmatimonadaceae bacterium]